MKGSGLKEVWIESGVVGSGAADAVLYGKKYKRAMRVHKLTLEALWAFVLPDLMQFLEENNSDLYLQIVNQHTSTDQLVILCDLLNSPAAIATLHSFVEERKQQNVNFSFWWSYMKMVSTIEFYSS